MTPNGGPTPVARLLTDHAFWVESVELLLRAAPDSPVKSFLLNRVEQSKRIAGAMRKEAIGQV